MLRKFGSAEEFWQAQASFEASKSKYTIVMRFASFILFVVVYLCYSMYFRSVKKFLLEYIYFCQIVSCVINMGMVSVTSSY